MRTLIKVLVLAMAIAFEATAQARRTTDITAGPSGRCSRLGVETGPTGMNVVSGKFGWPSVRFGITHGYRRDTDIGARFDLLFGVEGVSNNSQFGIGFRAPLRMVALRNDRISVLLHFDPGIKLFTTSPALFGFSFPVGAVIGYAATRDVTVAFGIDLPMTLYVTPSPVRFVISPMFGPAAEVPVDPPLAGGLTTPVRHRIYSTRGSDFRFVTQPMLGHRM